MVCLHECDVLSDQTCGDEFEHAFVKGTRSWEIGDGVTGEGNFGEEHGGGVFGGIYLDADMKTWARFIISSGVMNSSS